MSSGEVSFNLEIQIKDIDYQKGPYFLAPEATIAEAIELFRAKNCGAVLVMENKKLIGIFTERDYIRKIANEKIDTTAVKVSSFMTAKPDCYCVTDSVAMAMVKMQMRGYRHLVVIDNKEQQNVLGVLSIRDLLSFFCEAMRASSKSA